MRSYNDLLLARFMRDRRPRDFAALFDRTVLRLLRRARQVDPRRAGQLVKATFEAILFRKVEFDPDRLCMPFLLDVMLRQAGVPRPTRGPSSEPATRTAG